VTPGGRIPFVDLGPQHTALRAELDEAFARVLSSRRFVLGPEVDAFERELASAAGATHAVGVANGTDAIELALRAVGVTPGCEVIMPALTFVATALAALRIGARPVLVDVDADSLLMDPAAVEAAITPRTRALVPVHLYGQPCEVDELVEIANRRGLRVVWDACQAHGALYRGKRMGELGEAAAFSFYPSKNLGALGDGGAVVTCDAEIHRKLLSLRNYGSPRRYEHPSFGVNSRLDELQAALLRVKLPHLESWNARRNAIAARYREGLRALEPIRPVAQRDNRQHVYHLFVVRCRNRDTLQSRLDELLVDTQIHYPLPVHLHGATAELGYARGAFPVAESACREILSLPMYPELADADVDRVLDRLSDAVRTPSD